MIVLKIIYIVHMNLKMIINSPKIGFVRIAISIVQGDKTCFDRKFFTVNLTMSGFAKMLIDLKNILCRIVNYKTKLE